MANTSSEAQRLVFSVGGKRPDDQYIQDIQEIVVDSSMRVPDMASIYLYDSPNLDLIGKMPFKVGDDLYVFSYFGGKTKDQIFGGLITSIEPYFDREGRANLLIQGYDRSFLLHRGKYNKTFLDQTDKSIMEQMLKGTKLSLDYDAPDIQHPFIMQVDQTRMEWILMRAEQLGAQVFVRDKTLHFWKASKMDTSSKPKLVWTDNLLSFRARVSAVHQPSSVRSVSWDLVKSQEIVANKSVPSSRHNPIAKTKNKYSYSDDPEVQIFDIPFESKSAGDALSEGLLWESQNQLVMSEGVAVGNAQIVVGGMVEIAMRKDARSDYSGDYQVSSVRHVFRRSGRWETQFTINGREANTLSGLLNGHQGREAYNNRINGVVLAKVTNFKDPEDLGRVKVAYLMMHDDKGKPLESNWAPVLSPSAGGKRGFFYIPEVNDMVLVAFEFGDPQRPFVIGSMWDKKSLPPKKSSEVNDGSNITQRIITSRSGHTIVLDDSSGQESILIQDKSQKNLIKIDTAKNAITIEAQGDISVKSGANVSIEAKGKISMKSQMDTSIDASTTLKMESKTSATLKSVAITVDATGNMDLKAANLNATGNAAATIKGGAMVQVQGAIIKLN